MPAFTPYSKEAYNKVTATVQAKDGKDSYVSTRDGTLTLSFKPGLGFPKWGGKIEFRAPNWFTTATSWPSAKAHYLANGKQTTISTLSDELICSSEDVVIIPDKPGNEVCDDIQGFAKNADTTQPSTKTIAFSRFDPAKETITIVCTNYKNPVYPQQLAGFKLKVVDRSETAQDAVEFPDFALDARNLKPVVLDAGSPAAELNAISYDGMFKIEYTLPGETQPKVLTAGIPVQTQVNLRIAFSLPVAVDGGGCWLKY